MRKVFLFIGSFLLLISVAGCGATATESIHKKVHSAYYDMPTYSAKCTVTSYTKGGQNDYECTVNYNKDNNSYKVVSSDMEIDISEEKTIISKGGNVLEAPSSGDDMSIFLNTFFKSYYESESTALTSSQGDISDATLLECDVINPTMHTSYMKLWVDNKTAQPLRMQVYGKDDFLNTEVTFITFTKV